MINPPQAVALREKDARAYLGVTEYIWKTRVKKVLKPHPVTKTYLVKDLRAVLGLDHEDGQDQENHAAGRHQEENLQVRPRSGGKNRRGSQAPHPLD